MTFGSLLFLSFLGLWIVPLILALLQRRRRVFLPFGAYYLLERLMKTRLRAFQIHQWLKLLNRLILIALVAAYFADLKISRDVYETEGDLFAVFVDVGRAAQIRVDAQLSVGEMIEKSLRETLKKIPLNARGLVFAFSDRCETLSDFARAEDLPDSFDLPFANADSSDRGLSACEARFHQLIGEHAASRFLISSFPNSLVIDSQKSKYRILLATPPDYVAPKTSTISITESDDILKMDAREEYELSTIDTAEKMKARSQGVFASYREWPLQSHVWIWLRSIKEKSHDFWASSFFKRMNLNSAKKMNLWAKTESRGFLSLYTALKNSPTLEVVRWIGEEPPDFSEPLIAYGDIPVSWDQREKVWAFLSPQREHLLMPVRDRKIWTPETKGSDAENAFIIDHGSGRILIRQNLILDTKGLRAQDAFRDGTPSLLIDSRGRWITPFDLEDLTTDLTLESTFIPYLYKNLDLFLKEEIRKQDDLQALWLFPSWKQPSRNSVAEKRWPGIYGHGTATLAVQPIEAPLSFQTHLANAASQGTQLRKEWMSLRHTLVWFFGGSILLELLLCWLFTRKRLLAAMIFGIASWMGSGTLEEVVADPVERPLTVCVAPSIDIDRKRSLQQLGADFARLSNIDMTEPVIMNEKNLSSCVLVFFASNSAIHFTAQERERFRIYLEQGGLFVFDDPLAILDTEFSRSVRKEMELIFPGRHFEDIARENVIFKTFYLMSEVSGRRLASPHMEGLLFDNRWVAVWSSNDLLGSQLKTTSGDYAMSVSPYGQSQRISARRQLLNFVMYSATLNYKDDAIHLPHILKRRSR